ncbi:MAG: twin-arginine translocation signal domain-containing protein [Acidiferrobacterales bacterium]
MSAKKNHSKLSRRKFFKQLGAGTAAAAIAATLPAPTKAPVPKRKHYGMLIDTRRAVAAA